MNRNFFNILRTRTGFNVCIGLDPDEKKIPEHIKRGAGTLARAFQFFCCQIVDETKDYALAYKPNSAFFEAQGADGIISLQAVISYIKKVAPETVIILDAKRGDIGNTNDGYVKFAFDYLGADAITAHPYMGQESLQPFLDQKDKGIFVLCRTSNPKAGELQDLECGILREPLYQIVARNVATEWNRNKNCALVVGATAPAELAEVRSIVGPNMTILIPGIGAQGGDLEASAKAGGPNIIVNSSRGIIYATDPRAEAKKLHEATRACF